MPRVYAERRRERLARDPEALAAYRERQREYNRRWRERNRERAREQNRRFRERRRLLREEEEWMGTREVLTLDVKAHANTRGAMVDVGPFRRWIEREIAARTDRFRRSYHPNPSAEAKQQVASMIGVSIRTLYRYRYELKVCPEGIVDHALSRDGRYHLYDLYPYLAEVDVDVPEQLEMELAA